MSDARVKTTNRAWFEKQYEGYIPTTAEVRDYFVNGQFADGPAPDEAEMGFQRWLAARDAALLAVTDERVEAACAAYWNTFEEGDRWERVLEEQPETVDDMRVGMRAALAAAQAVAS